MATLNEQPLERVTDRLSVEFSGVFKREIVDRAVRDAHQRLLATARVSGFISLLAERDARDRLRALAADHQEQVVSWAQPR
jgi:arsenate reductase